MVYLAKPTVILPLPVEDLHHPHPADVLVERGVYLRYLQPHQPKGIPGLLPKDHSNPASKGNDYEADQGQLPIYVDEDYQNP